MSHAALLFQGSAVLCLLSLHSRFLISEVASLSFMDLRSFGWILEVSGDDLTISSIEPCTGRGFCLGIKFVVVLLGFQM